ncbi:MAG: hypothetical protein IJ524_00850 [Bacteroidales bacterium]|nr:hypothetical protein [Bacteroidales bacterium]
MKTKGYVLGLTLMLGLTGCTKEITAPAVELDFDQTIYSSVTGDATIIGRVTDDGGELSDAGICYIKATSGVPEMNDNKHSVGANKEIKVELTGLSAGTYRVRAYATNRVATAYSDIGVLTITGPSYAPTVVWNTSSSSYNASAGTASLYATVTSNGGAAVTSAGFCYIKGDSGTPTTANSRWASSSLTDIHVEVSNLTSGTYRMRPYATNSQGTGYGEVRTMTIDRSGGTRTLNDFLGTWSCQATDWRNNSLSWYGTSITSLSGNQVLVEGLYRKSNGGPAGSYFYAVGEFNATKQCIVLKGGYILTDLSDYTYHWNSAPDTVLIATFYPMYENSDGSWYALKDANGGYNGEAYLKFNSAGKLVFGPSDTPSSDGHYADGYSFYESYADTEQPRGWASFVITSLTMTKTSSKGGGGLEAVAPLPDPDGARPFKQR